MNQNDKNSKNNNQNKNNGNWRIIIESKAISKTY